MKRGNEGDRGGRRARASLLSGSLLKCPTARLEMGSWDGSDGASVMELWNLGELTRQWLLGSERDLEALQERSDGEGWGGKKVPRRQPGTSAASAHCFLHPKAA